jgi:hypothetical protein
MQRIFRTLLFWTLILCACSAGGLSPDASSSEPAVDIPSPFVIPVSTTEVLPPDKLIATVATPHIDQPPDGNVTTAAPADPGCAYQWAYEDLPKLSGDFQKSIQQLQAGAQASAFAFGENCVHADGRTDFIAMETDFNVTLQVTDPSNEAELGGWIVKVMQVIDKIPIEMIVGPRPGRVSISFQSSGDQMFANFYIDEYRSLPSGLSDAEIYQALQIPQ